MTSATLLIGLSALALYGSFRLSRRSRETIAWLIVLGYLCAVLFPGS